MCLFYRLLLRGSIGKEGPLLLSRREHCTRWDLLPAPTVAEHGDPSLLGARARSRGEGRDNIYIYIYWRAYVRFAAHVNMGGVRAVREFPSVLLALTFTRQIVGEGWEERWCAIA